MAFIKTAPPTVPLSPENRSSPPRLFFLQKSKIFPQEVPACTERIKLPASGVFIKSIPESFLVERTMSVPFSLKITLLPPPRTKKLSLSSWNFFTAYTRLSVFSGSTKKFALPPAQIVVCFERLSFFFTVP